MAAAIPTVVTLLVLAIAIFVGYKYLQARVCSLSFSAVHL